MTSPSSARLRTTSPTPCSVAGCAERVAPLALIALAVGAPALAATVDPGTLPAEQAPLAERSLLLDIAQAGSRFVAVGDRGHVLFSDNRGQMWTQAQSVPTQVLLTAVCFSDEKQGVAVGHDEVALVTSDAGNSWQRTHFNPEAQQPLLDVTCNGADVIAVGAYGAYYTSRDRGVTWEARRFEAQPLTQAGAAGRPGGSSNEGEGVDEDDGFEDLGADYHLNRIVAASGSRLYIAGEAGSLYRSNDAGATWSELPSPYEGSFFGLLPLNGDSLLAYGLRGNAFRSDDGGQSWRRIELGTDAMLNDAVRLPKDGVAIVGLSGTVLVSRDGGKTFTTQQQADRKGLSAAVAVGTAELITVGEAGIKPIALGASQ